MKRFSFFSKKDKSQEAISTTKASGRLAAAKYFAAQKKLSLKQFLRIFSISK
jgi:hypothetical protein